MKILVLDNDEQVLDVVRRILIENGHEPECANNAKEAQELVASREYDFILVDYKMPNNDGIWFMENTEIPGKTKVLLVTAYVNRNVINRMFDLGICGYIIKPFGEDELLRHLSYHSD